MGIHATAVISPEAEIAPEAEIGPYCVITGPVRIGAHTVIDAHARIGSTYGAVSIGERNYIQGGASLGGPPQDLGYASGFRGRLEIGDDNRIGEFVTISLGTEKGGGVTRIGHRNLLMAYVHVGHDCEISDEVILTNTCQLAGHVVVEDRALVSGHTGVAQFCRLGTCSFLVAGSFANKDIPPYTIAEGYWATLRATNKVGLKRAGLEAAERANVDRAVRLLLDRGSTVVEAIARIRNECAPTPRIDRLVEFLKTSKKGIARR
ncbi:MAG TPA: acyl-ACP--UDP-N-acetylglucosamine O-acyltransferase [Gammaproteobacteria bacterium]|nr:acyl-ACP--UDP-N-acetylglucosamine O-acyltransferase [Gammaproteobacteria bacterium]